MPMRYATEATVLAMLKIASTSTAEIARVVELENGLAAAFDGKLGRSFGGSATATTRTFTAAPSPVLVIGGGARTVTGVETGGTWDGTDWMNATALGADEWRVWSQTPNGVIYAIELLAGDWIGAVRVTGVFADQQDGAVPDDVREALTTLTVKEYRRRTASPSEQVGPDGLIVATPSGWNDPTVQAAIAHHRVVKVVV